MVQTRRQYRQWVDQGMQESDEECEECSQSQQEYDNSYEFENGTNIERDPPETCRRHRARDNDPYSVDVISYKRRTPKRY